MVINFSLIVTFYHHVEKMSMVLLSPRTRADFVLTESTGNAVTHKVFDGVSGDGTSPAEKEHVNGFGLNTDGIRVGNFGGKSGFSE